jgi:hypothetical protein
MSACSIAGPVVADRQPAGGIGGEQDARRFLPGEMGGLGEQSARPYDGAVRRAVEMCLTSADAPAGPRHPVGMRGRRLVVHLQATEGADRAVARVRPPGPSAGGMVPACPPAAWRSREDPSAGAVGRRLLGAHRQECAEHALKASQLAMPECLGVTGGIGGSEDSRHRRSHGMSSVAEASPGSCPAVDPSSKREHKFHTALSSDGP